jgi:hypothetical protein
MRLVGNLSIAEVCPVVRNHSQTTDAVEGQFNPTRWDAACVDGLCGRERCADPDCRLTFQATRFFLERYGPILLAAHPKAVSSPEVRQIQSDRHSRFPGEQHSAVSEK